MNSEISNSLLEDLVKTMDRIERRLTDVETALNLRAEKSESQPLEEPKKKKDEDDDSLELAIGEYWFAKIGILAFLFGMFFLITQPLDNYPPALPVAIGYILSFAFIVIPEIWLKSFKYISGYLIGGGTALFYLTTLRLHFFALEPIIASRIFVVILLLIVGGFATWVALKRQSVYLVALAELFFMMTVQFLKPDGIWNNIYNPGTLPVVCK
jgi:uncharacterized membrane protein